jgi:hypothetical protein
MQPDEFRSDLDLSSIGGLTVDAYAQDDGYWHLFVALRLVGGNSIVFTTEERSAGARFEVFPIAAQHHPVSDQAWRLLPTLSM